MSNKLVMYTLIIGNLSVSPARLKYCRCAAGIEFLPNQGQALVLEGDLSVPGLSGIGELLPA
jgi:hypothetical protein